jgi:hypothetical protein
MSYFMWEEEGHATFNVLLPGAIFTSASVFIFVLHRIECKPEQWLFFYLAMCSTYMLVYCITYLTVWVSFLTGIFTGGIGALATFMLTVTFITKISFSKKNIFVCGGLAFLIHVIFLINPLNKWLAQVFDLAGLTGNHHAHVIWLWQVIVGTALVFALQNRTKPQLAGNI